MKHIIKLDMEPWQFILYEVDGTDWIVDFPYSPISSVDVSMSIKLNTEEKLRAKENRQFLIEFSETLRNNYKAFQERALDFNISIKYKELLHGT